jgi:hypothetical protein
MARVADVAVGRGAEVSLRFDSTVAGPGSFSPLGEDDGAVKQLAHSDNGTVVKINNS